MKFNGIEVVEMSPEKWDGHAREMLVWNFTYEETMPAKKKVVEWFADEYGHISWRDAHNFIWNHCAEIPKKEENKEDICANVIIDTKREHEELKAEIRSLKIDRQEMASAISNAVWRELMDRAKNIEGPVNTTMVGFGFNDISDIVLNKILDYKSDYPVYKSYSDEEPYISNNMATDEIIKKFEKLRSELIRWLAKNNVGNLLVNNLKYGIGIALNLSKSKKRFADVATLCKLVEKSPEKKYRRMTHRELAIWCAKGNGEWTNAGMRTAYQHYDYDIDEESEIVSEHIKIRACDETEWHEPLVEVSVEENA